MKKHARRTRTTLTAALAITLTLATWSYAALPSTLSELIVNYLTSRDATIQLASPGQLSRRLSIDLTGVVPTIADQEATSAMSPAAMFDYFANKPALDHTFGERAYVWSNLIKDADHFLFSNNNQFSQVAHITEFRDQLRRVYAEGYSYKEFARWALSSQMFLNRFPSAADRANASFFLYLGRDSFASEVPSGNMWNGYRLVNPGIPESQAETNADYHRYVYDQSVCDDGTSLCEATLWNTTGATPAEIIDLILDSPMFAEATVARYWERMIGKPLPGVEFPDIREVLVRGLIAADYDINWLLKEIATSPAYSQEMMFR